MKRQYRRIVGKYKMYLYELQKGEEKWASNLFWIMLWSLVLSSFDIVDFWSYLQIIAGVPACVSLVKEGKYKQWWSTIPTISTKPTITSHLKSLNTNRHWPMMLETQDLPWNTHNNVVGLIYQVMVNNCTNIKKTNNHLSPQILTLACDVGNTCLVLEQAQTCGGVKLVNGFPIPSW